MSYEHQTDGHMIIANETDDRNNHMLRLNSMLCEMWPFTPHGKDGAPVPNCVNGDVVLGSDIDARLVYYVDSETERKSHQYWIVDDGRVVCDTDELMDLKSATHLTAIIYTIIADIYGPYDGESAFKAWMKSIGIGE